MASVASDSAPRRGVPVQHRTSSHVSPSDESQVALRVAVTARLSPELRRRAPKVADRHSDVGPHRECHPRARGGRRARLWPCRGPTWPIRHPPPLALRVGGREIYKPRGKSADFGFAILKVRYFRNSYVVLRWLVRLQRCTPSSPIPVGHSSEATSLNSAKLCPTPTPHRSDPGPATYMVALSALRRVRPYRWRPLSPNTAICGLHTVSAAGATWRQA